MDILDPAIIISLIIITFVVFILFSISPTNKYKNSPNNRKGKKTSGSKISGTPKERASTKKTRKKKGPTDVVELLTNLDSQLAQLKSIDSTPERSSIKAILHGYASPLLITVLGEFSSGKSTFINALMGQKLLAMKIRPTTATITRMQHGERNRLIVHYNDGKTDCIPMDELESVTVENFVTGKNILDDIDYVQLEFPHPLLKHFDLADTPGFNSNLERHTEITSEFIAYSDVIFWVFDSNQLEKNSTFELIKKHCPVRKPIGIINKIDLIPDEERKKATEDLQKALNEVCQASFPISAKGALKDNNSVGVFDFEAVIKYIEKEIIPNAQKSKTDIIKSKISDVALSVGAKREGLHRRLDGLTTRIKEFEQKETDIEKLFSAHDKAIAKFNADLKNKNRSLFTNIQELNSYYLSRSMPQRIQARSKSFVSEKKSWDTEDGSLNRRKSTLDSESRRIDESLSEIKQRWNEYNDKPVKGFFDAVGGIFDIQSDEVIELNQDSANWDDSRDKYNAKVDTHNKELNAHWRNYERLENNILDFINNVVVTELNKYMETLNKEGAKLEKLESILRKEYEKAQPDYQDLEILESDVFETILALYSQVHTNIDKAYRSQIKDFEQLVKHASKQSVASQDKLLKDVYSRKHMDSVIVSSNLGGAQTNKKQNLQIKKGKAPVITEA
jgi:GTPase SAR1 family protein